MEGIHISLAAEQIGTFMGLPITNTLITSWVVMALIISVGVFVGRKVSLIPTRLQTLIEWMFEGVHDFVGTTLEHRKVAMIMFPLLFTLFLFIAVSNAVEFTPGIGSVGFYQEAESESSSGSHALESQVLTEGSAAHEEESVVIQDTEATHAEPLAVAESEAVVAESVHGEVEFIPLFRSVNTDLNVTLALTIITVIMIEIMGVMALGFFRYTGKFINFSGHSIGERLLNFVVGLIELVSEVSRLISFSFRLFGNIFAGEVLLAVAAFFVPYVLPVPLMAFETFVGFVQAAVFALLALFFTKMAIAEPHSSHAEAH